MHEPTLWHTDSDFYAIQTPTFMPYEPFLLGVGVVFNILSRELAVLQYTPIFHVLNGVAAEDKLQLENNQTN